LFCSTAGIVISLSVCRSDHVAPCKLNVYRLAQLDSVVASDDRGVV
jgi:hypothetical protein